MGAVYFDYQGKFPPNGFRYIVEVSKRDANGVDRSPIELRIVAWSNQRLGTLWVPFCLDLSWAFLVRLTPRACIMVAASLVSVITVAERRSVMALNRSLFL